VKITDRIFYYPEHGGLDSNTYVINNGTYTIFDPGSIESLPQLLAEIENDGINIKEIKTIVHSHLHIDHYSSNKKLKLLSGAEILIHPLQKQYWDTTIVQTTRLFGISPVIFQEDGLLDGSTLSSFEMIASPGHSPDSICYYDKADKLLVCGDVIFAGNIGRADLPGGDSNQLKRSITALSALDIEYLLPGHMHIVEGNRSVKQNFKFITENAFTWL
jgi:hydroxyacylglutathione hydrolase